MPDVRRHAEQMCIMPNTMIKDVLYRRKKTVSLRAHEYNINGKRMFIWDENIRPIKRKGIIMKLNHECLKKLVEKGTVVIKDATTHTPSRNAVDGPVLGNGDMGAVIKTETDGFTFLLGKNDFWRQPQLYMTEQQLKEQLLNENCRRTGGRIIPVGWIRLKFNGLMQTEFYMEQSIYDAQIKIKVRWHNGELLLNAWICAGQNTLVIEMDNQSDKEAVVDFGIMPGEYDVYEESGYDDGYTDNSVWFTYGAEPYNVPGRRFVGAAAAVNVPVIFDPQRMTQKGGVFSVTANGQAKLLLTLLSDLDAENPKKEALALNEASLRKTEEMRLKHLRWWQEFWGKSAVETGDDTLDSYYYSSLYWLGCCTREGKVPPAIYGPWTTSDLAPWSGAYTLNYNFQSPFFCLYTSNRQDLIRSYIDPLLDIIPIGEMYAKEKFGKKGICLPVEIGPFGTVCSGNFFGQKTNAAYCCVNIFMHFFSTYDAEWGQRAYPFVKKTAEFWEDDLVYENGIYNVVGDCAHEEIISDGGERNNTHGLGLVMMLFNGIIKMSRALEIDEDKREKWVEIVTHLPEFPTYVRNGQTVYKYNEDKYEWLDTNGTPVKFIYPFGCIGPDSDERTLEIARNTLEQKDYLFFQANAYCEYVQMRARVNCDPQKTYEKMIEGCTKLSFANRYMTAHGGGIEDFSAIPAGINEMMLQSHDEVIRVFPSWPQGKNASFMNLRAYGAFLVSAERKNDEIVSVEIVSEKGKQLVLQNPWEKALIIRNGQKQGIVSEARIGLMTEPGDVIYFEKC